MQFLPRSIRNPVDWCSMIFANPLLLLSATFNLVLLFSFNFTFAATLVQKVEVELCTRGTMNINHTNSMSEYIPLGKVRFQHLYMGTVSK